MINNINSFWPMAIALKSKLRTSCLLLAFFAVAANPMQAQIDRTRQPTPDPPPTASFPSYDRFTLSNGLQVYFIRDPRPIVTFRLQVRGGNSVDGNLPGLADAVADQMIKGTTKRSSQEFAKKIDFVGGSIGASAGPDMINVVASGLKKHMGTILDLYAEAIKMPAYPETELTKYKQEQITSLQSQKADAEYLASTAVNRVLFGTTPYGQFPTEDVINKLTPAAISKYHKTYIVPGNSSLAVVGDFTVDELKGKLESAFSDWKKGSAKAAKAPKFPAMKGRKIILVDRPASVQSSIRVIARGPLNNNPERPNFRILNSILGGGTGLGNRLTMNLRETHGYTYTPGSYFDANVHAGYFIALADVRNAVTDSALTEMIGEIERIQREQVSEDELRRNIQSETGTFLMSIADPATTAQRVQFLDFYGLPKDYYNRLVQTYTGTTREQVQSLAKKYLNSNDLTVVVVGKASEVKPKLEKFGKVEVWDTELKPVVAMTGSSSGINAEETWSRMVDAMGGKRKIQAITSLRSSGKVTAPPGLPVTGGTLVREQSAPNKLHEVLDLGMIKQEKWIDGSKGFAADPGQPVRELTGDELAKELEGAHINAEAFLQEIGGKVTAKGKKQVNGRETIVLEAAMPKSDPTTYYVDAKTFLPVMQESGGTMITLDDWRDVGDGVKMAHSMVLEPQPGLKFTISDIKYELNPKFDSSIFSKK